jgi:S-DNA-T family DNA segregation ATPase FtsK/SpoIIIE
LAQAIRKRPARPVIPEVVSTQLIRHLREGALVLLIAVSLFVLFALLSYEPADPGWSHTGAGRPVANSGGVVGAWLADLLFYLFGYLAYLVPWMVGYSGWLLFQGRADEEPPDYLHTLARLAGFVVTIAVGCGLAWIHFRGGPELPHHGAGIVGNLVGQSSVSVFGRLGGTLLMVGAFLSGITLFTGLSWLKVMDLIGKYTLDLYAMLQAAVARYTEGAEDYAKGSEARREREETVKFEIAKVDQRPKPRIAPPVISKSEPTIKLDKKRQESLFDSGDTVLPPLNLLDAPPPPKGGYSRETLEAISRQVELKLQDFGIEVAVVAVHPGPVITRFELQPAPGIKASRITALSKDLARSLSTVSVRVVEVIPGKSVIGLEIPNQERELVTLREILSASEYEASASPLTMALGKDIAGKPAVADLARMPHLLVAGTTGAGKSVALNAMILSILYKASAKDVRVIMIDPKMLELSVYEGIPSLLAPVVTDMKEAANALRWCVAEMERRYRLMASLGVRNISGYNRKVQDAAADGGPIIDPLWRPEFGGEAPALESLPYIVVIVDELADMMMTVGKKVEELIARLAQKARAAGIHLILATQRPSVDVITGLIKANIPSRIAFQVSSRIDSRTILDQMGAESLLGHGDMLYLPPGTGLPNRVHGAFVSDQEVHKVVAYLKSRGSPNYVQEIITGPEESDAAGEFFAGSGSTQGDESDELYDQAVRIVTESRRASVSGVQRRLKIGYNRAARLVEEMERAGIVGALQSNGTRDVLAPPPPKD